MRRLDFLIGRWHGTGWTEVNGRVVRFDQDESVRSLLGGDLLTVEGRATAPDDPDDVRFTAFAIARYDTGARAFTFGGPVPRGPPARR